MTCSLFFLKTQSVINNVSFALYLFNRNCNPLSINSRKSLTKFGRLSRRCRTEEYHQGLLNQIKLQRILQPLRFHHKTMSIPLQHVSLYYELELFRNVFIGDNGLLLKIEIPMSSQSPICKFFKGVPLPQSIAISFYRNSTCTQA